MDMAQQPKQTLQSRSEQTLQRILKACDELISQKSFEQISMQEIAKTAGVSVGNLYNRFEDKDALVDYVLVSHQQRAMTGVAAQLADQPADLPLQQRFEVVAEAIAAGVAPLAPIFATMAARQARGADISTAAHTNSDALIDLMTDWVLQHSPELDGTRCRFAVASIAFSLQYNVMFGTPERLFGDNLINELSNQAYTYAITTS